MVVAFLTVLEAEQSFFSMVFLSEEFISGSIAADAQEGSVLFAGFQPILGGVYSMGAIGLHYTAHLRHYPGYVFAGSFK